MRYLTWILRGALFLFLLGFAVKNDQLVTLHFFFGNEWNLPLVFVIFVFFALGIVLGIVSTAVSWLKQRRELARLRKQMKLLEASGRETALVPRPDGDSPALF